MMDSDTFHTLVKGFFGRRATGRTYDPVSTVFTCVLYETFPFKCGLDGEHGSFSAGIESVSGRYLTTFFGEWLSFDSDSESIAKSLAIVDEWCRLHLSDKFLERYEAGIAAKPEA